MRLVIQRVLEACVSIDGKEVPRIGKGLLVLVGVPLENRSVGECSVQI